MTAKELFREISNMESFIETKKQRVAVLTDLVSSPGGANYSGMPHNPSPDPSRTATIIYNKIQLEQEIQEDEQKLQEKKLYALNQIASLDSADYQSILVKRYFEHLSWDEISSVLFYSLRWTYYLHGHALEALDRKLAEELKECS